LTEKVDDQHHGTKKAWLDFFGFVNSKLILQVCSTTTMIRSKLNTSTNQT